MQLIFQVNGLKFGPGSKLGLIFGSNLGLAQICVERLKVKPIFGPKFGPFGSIFGSALN
jgi:hypothetical protein